MVSRSAPCLPAVLRSRLPDQRVPWSASPSRRTCGFRSERLQPSSRKSTERRPSTLRCRTEGMRASRCLTSTFTSCPGVVSLCVNACGFRTHVAMQGPKGWGQQDSRGAWRGEERARDTLRSLHIAYGLLWCQHTRACSRARAEWRETTKTTTTFTTLSTTLMPTPTPSPSSR